MARRLRWRCFMAGNWLSVVGAAALVACGAAGVAALVLVPERVTLVLAEESGDAARGPDPSEVLRADVAALREDLGALSAALGPQLQQLHDSLDAADTQRSDSLREGAQRLHESLAALDGRVAKLELGVQSADAEQRRAAVRVEQALAELREQALAEMREHALAESQRESEPVEVPSTASVDVAAAGSEVGALGAIALETGAVAAETLAPESVPVKTAPVAVAAPETAVETPPKRSFLSFSLPSQKFSFQGRQRLAVVPSLSRVGFDAKSTLHDFSGVTQKVEGELEVDLAAPQSECRGAVRVEAKTLDTGMADRDKGLRELLEVEKHAQLSFAWTSFRDARVDLAGERVTGVAVGKLSIKGVEREVAMPVRVSVDASKRVSIDGELGIKLRDFGLEPPSQLGVISVGNEVKVWIALRARSLGASSPSKSEGGDGR